MNPRDIRVAGIHHLEETRGISRNLVEKAMHMRCLSYLAGVKASLLTQTIFETSVLKLKFHRF